jgi:DNA-binding CsgD family transcriptional regulator
MLDVVADLTAASTASSSVLDLMLAELPRAIACDSVLVTLGGSAPFATLSSDPRIPEARRADMPGWFECILEHPIVEYRHRTNDLQSALKFSDFVDLRSLDRTRMYQEFWRPADVRYKLSVALPLSADRIVDVGFTRSSRDFDERDRTVLQLLAPRLRGVLRRAVGMPDEPDGRALTPREREILAMVVAGGSNKEIAKDLFVSAATVRKHLENIYAKLGVHSRTEAAAVARAQQ